MSADMSPPVICRIPFSGKAHTSPAPQRKHRTYSTSPLLPPPTQWKITPNLVFLEMLSLDNLWKEKSSPFLLEAARWGGKKTKKHSNKKKQTWKILSSTFCDCIIIYFCFHKGSLLDVYDNISLGSSHHGHCKENRNRNKISLMYVAECVWYHSFCVNTSSRHADFIVDAIRVTAELLKAVDGALTHDRFPTERSVVDDLEHNGRGVHLLFGEKLDEKPKKQAM